MAAKAMITVRLPRATHEALKALAHGRYLSLNRLIVLQLESLLAEEADRHEEREEAAAERPWTLERMAAFCEAHPGEARILSTPLGLRLEDVRTGDQLAFVATPLGATLLDQPARNRVLVVPRPTE